MKDRWSQLSMSEKSDLMSLYIRNGISSLEEMKKHYNSFATGGHLYQDGGPDDKENKQVKAPTWLKMWNHRNDEHYMTDKYSPQELDTLRRRLYANLLPYNYPLREYKLW